jgi:hypothetical protein
MKRRCDMEYKHKMVTGYWTAEPQHIFTVKVALGEWDGIEDAEDDTVFHYMDNEPLTVGCTISEGFIVNSIIEEV